MGIATQRVSHKISGSYQEVLKWARTAETSAAFFARLGSKGVANDEMRAFVATTRAHLVAGGVPDEDEPIWRFLRRMLILEFDFEAAAPLSRTYALTLARAALADDDAGRAEALWSSLIDLSIKTGTTGGAVDRESLRATLAAAGFCLAGDRDYAPARAKLADMAQMTLAGIGSTVAGVNLPRLDAVGRLDEAMDSHRFVEVRGGPGVGKSWVLRHAAERVARHAPIIVLDPVATPPGGWIAFAQSLGIPGTAVAFLGDLAASGGAVIFIDGLDMFTDPGRQRTVSELLRAAGEIPGFKVIATSRALSAADIDLWLSEDIVSALGGVHPVLIGELSDDEVAILIEQAPELRVLLDADHPAASLARNLYRLSRLLKVPSSTEIRTEAALARNWWNSADGAPAADVREAQRILAGLADRALEGEIGIELQSDSTARTHLLGALTLKEVRRDRLDFYHDVLRDWAIGNVIAEDLSRLDAIDLSLPVSSRVARGIEFAGRLALEAGQDCTALTALLTRLSPEGAHSSWRRQALLAMIRSEAGFELLEKCSVALLADGGALFIELCTTIIAVETVATVDIMKSPDGSKLELPRSYRTNTTGSAIWVLRWVLNHVAEIPLLAIPSVVELVLIQVQLLKLIPPFAGKIATTLFGWLRQLDVREAEVTIPGAGRAGRTESDARRRMIEKLRMVALVLGEHAPHQLKAYLTELAAERDSYKVKAIRPLSRFIAPVAPAELSALILASLIEKRERVRRDTSSMPRAFTFANSDYLPPSPAQPPFLDLLEAAPEEGLKLIRALVAEAVANHVEGQDREGDGFTLVFDDGPRFFPWTDTYLWSRDQAREYSAASGLKALEAWSQKRLDDGEAVETVLADILGPEGSCAAYLLVAVDVLLSHFNLGREALVPFIACPELLADDKRRVVHDHTSWLDRWAGENEPAGSVQLADLRARDSRGLSLQDAMIAYLSDDTAGRALRERLAAAVAKLEPYQPYSSWVDARFVGRYAVNYLDLTNWTEIEAGKLAYQPPTDEAAHLEQLGDRHRVSVQNSETEARISLALEGGEYATVESARIAIEYADGDLPDDSDTDSLKSRSTRLITTALLIARDGDDALLDAHEAWARQVIELGLAEQSDRVGRSSDTVRYNRPAIATLALIHLWLRKRIKADRDALIALATRRDRSAAPAFATALPKILDSDPKVFKAAMRAAFSSVLWRRHSYDEDEAVHQRFEASRDAAAQAAVAAEIGWLDGGEEPAWPEFPKERPLLRDHPRIRLPAAATVGECEANAIEEAKSAETSNVHVDSQAAAEWLDMLSAATKGKIDWSQEIVEAYSAWTAKMNGLGLPAETEIDRSPDAWNLHYYALFAAALMDAPADRFDVDLKLVTGLPDEPFGDVAQSVIHAADALYFNDPQRAAARAVELRTRMVDRVKVLRRWRYADDPASLRIDHDTGGIVAKVLLNTYDVFNGTRSYLPPALSDRLDPLLAPIRPLLSGGPTSFVALCVMNLLMVTPRPRHLDFLLEAVEAWFARVPAAPFWTAMGIGARIVEWFEAATVEEPALLAPAHPSRDRIDRLVGRLVAIGVAEAHELERKIEQVIVEGEATA